jgi:hypothetical protein
LSGFFCRYTYRNPSFSPLTKGGIRGVEAKASTLVRLRRASENERKYYNPSYRSTVYE